MNSQLMSLEEPSNYQERKFLEKPNGSRNELKFQTITNVSRMRVQNPFQGSSCTKSSTHLTHNNITAQKRNSGSFQMQKVLSSQINQGTKTKLNRDITNQIHHSINFSELDQDSYPGKKPSSKHTKHRYLNPESVKSPNNDYQMNEP